MKLFRPLLLGLGILAALVAAAVLLAFTPAVQTWAVRTVLAADPGLTVEVGRVAAGLTTVRIENVRVRMERGVLIVPLAEIELPVVSAVLGRNVALTRMAAKGWTLDLVTPGGVSGSATISSPPAPTPAGYFAFLSTVRAQSSPGTQSGFSGVFGRLALPVDFAVEQAELEGEIRFARAAGQTPARARLNLTGGSLAVGSTGRFVLSSEVTVDDPSSPVDRVTARQEILLRMDTPRSLDRIEVTGAATATGPQFPNGVRVDIETSATRLAGGESYHFSLRSGNRVLAGVSGELPAGAESLSGTWVLDARSGDLSPFALGRPLPEFAAAGKGTLAIDRSFAEVEVAGRIDGSFQRLEMLNPGLQAVGPLRAAADFDLISRDADIRLSRLQLDVFSSQPVAGVTLLQGVEFSRANGELRVADISSDLLEIVLHGIPLTWVQPFLGDDLSLSGGDVKGGFVASVRAGRLVMRPTTPLAIDGLTLAEGADVLLASVDLAAEVNADYAPTGWQADVANVSVRSGSNALARLSVKAVQARGADQPLKLAGTYEIDLPSVLEQPVLTRYRGLTAGRMSGDFSASLGTAREFAAAITVSELAVATDVSLPAIKAEFRADRLADGTINARVPITLTRGDRISDVTANAAIKPAAGGLQLTASLAGDRVFVEDLQILTVLAPAEPGAPAAASSGAITPAPVWSGVSGTVSLDLKKVIYTPTIAADSVLGTIVIGPEAITFENVSAALSNGAGLRLGGDLAFESRQARAYGLKADVTVSNFDPVPLFRTINPTALPPVEGRFDISTRVSGQAKEIGSLAEAVTGTLKLSSRGGVLRALSIDASEFGRTGSRIASVAGLIGLATGDTRALKYADRLKAASELAQDLSTVAFDQLTIEIERGAGSDFEIRDLSLISPALRLLGSGRIRHEPGVAVWHQPLVVQLQLGARDRLADNLRVLKLAGDRADSLGYTPLLENFWIDGTLSAVGTTQLKERLIQALAGQ